MLKFDQNFRYLSIIGKITVVKCLLMPQFLYLMQSTILPTHILDRINTVLFKYIWSKNTTDIKHENDFKRIPEKIKRSTMIQGYEHGGLKMIDMKSMQHTLAIKWISKISKESNGSFQLIPKYYYNQISPKLSIFQSNIEYERLRGVPIQFPYFYKQLLKLWFDIKPWEEVKLNDTQVIWNNNLFTYHKHLFILKDGSTIE